MTLSSASTFDVVIAGAGVFGLWVAKRAVEAGLRVAVVERRAIGAGASGGLLGALMAHMPERWNAKKQFQLDALLQLPALTSELEAETGLSCGYARCGRIMPLRNEVYKGQMHARSDYASDRWEPHERGLGIFVRDDDRHSDWLAPDHRPYGYVFDSLAARIDPRAYLQALHAWLAPRAHFVFGSEAIEWRDGAVRLQDGARLRAAAFIACAGWEGFPLLECLTGYALGGGVKGEAVMLKLRHDIQAPMIYEDGVYAIPHTGGRVAVGSTSQKEWTHASAPSKEDPKFLEHARALSPLLQEAQIIERWAGVRPRCARRDPLVGRAPTEAPIWIATGGYKISFGVAHRVASALVERLIGASDQTALPQSFEPSHHFRA